jgi:hypothetical protein
MKVPPSYLREQNNMKKSHPYKETHVIHHKDGSHTIHHKHDSNAKKDKYHAVSDLDEVHDKLEENLGEPNEGEAAAPAGAPNAAPAPGMAGGPAEE